MSYHDMEISLSDLTKRCIGCFEEALKTAPVREKERLENRLADFKLWANGTGALAYDKASLDSRLSSLPDDLAVVEGILQMLHLFIQDCAAQIADCLPIDEVLPRIDSSLENLALLAVAIRRTGRRSRLRKADATYDPDEHEELRTHLECIATIRPSKNGWTPEHLSKQQLSGPQKLLIDANLRRRNIFIKAQRHAVKLEIPRETQSHNRSQNRSYNPSDKPSGDDEDLVPSIPAFEDLPSALPSIPNVPTSAGVRAVPNHLFDGRMTEAGTTASAAESKLRWSEKKPPAQQVPQTSITRITSMAFYPKPILPETERRLFQCPCCCQSIPIEDAKDNNKWRKHLAEDMCPYTCIADGCPTPHVYYATRSALEQHLRQDHKPIWECALCDDVEGLQAPAFFTMSKIMDHIRAKHDVPDDLLSNFISWSVKHGLGIDSCPLCESTGARDAPDLVEHVLEHIYDFSLRSLPWPKQTFVDSHSNDGAETFNLAIQEADYLIQWLMEVEPENSEHRGISLLSGLDRVRTSESVRQHLAPSTSEARDYYDNHDYFAEDENNGSCHNSDFMEGNSSTTIDDSNTDGFEGSSDPPNLVNDTSGSLEEEGEHENMPERITEDLQNPGITEQRLEHRMRAGLCKAYDGKEFLPVDVIEALTSPEIVAAQLEAELPSDLLAQSLVDYVVNPDEPAKKLFLALTFCKKLGELNSLYKAGFRDKHLPIAIEKNTAIRNTYRYTVRTLDTNQFWDAFSTWKNRDLEHFHTRQWYFMAPVFVPKTFNYHLNQNCPLPLTRKLSNPKVGFFSSVCEVEIHRAHQQVISQNDSDRIEGKSTRIASKEIRSDMEDYYQKEAASFRIIRQLKYAHLVIPLAAYTKGDLYGFLFPWAEGGNLKEFWKETKQRPTRDLMRWVIDQFCGICSVTKALHGKNYRCTNLKPENILLFKEHGPWGTLRIADVGLVKFHGDITRQGDSGTNVKTGTVRYEPPEMGRYQQRPGVYDVWCLGCIFLEFLIWAVYGHEGLDTFFKLTFEQQFFEKKIDGSYHQHREVKRWIAHMTELFQAGTALEGCLTLINEGMLVSSWEKRHPVADIHLVLEELRRTAYNEGTYLLGDELANGVVPLPPSATVPTGASLNLQVPQPNDDAIGRTAENYSLEDAQADATLKQSGINPQSYGDQIEDRLLSGTSTMPPSQPQVVESIIPVHYGNIDDLKVELDKRLEAGNYSISTANGEYVVKRHRNL